MIANLTADALQGNLAVMRGDFRDQAKYESLIRCTRSKASRQYVPNLEFIQYAEQEQNRAVVGSLNNSQDLDLATQEHPRVPKPLAISNAGTVMYFGICQ